MNILIGSDPELFVKKDGQFVSAFGLIEGTKHDPYPVNNGAVQVDGMALEFNTNPVGDEEAWIHNLHSVVQQLEDMVPDFEVVATPVAHFTPEYMESQPRAALELGCDPDFNAWEDGKVNKTPDACKPMRTGAGHIHIGWTEDEEIDDPAHLITCMELVRQLDFFLGLPSLLFDNDVERREMYGRAGCFRPKPYGVEYRVLSNKWMSDEKYQRWVFRATKAAIDSLIAGRKLEEIYGDISDIINSSDVDTATDIIMDAELEVPDA